MGLIGFDDRARLRHQYGLVIRRRRNTLRGRGALGQLCGYLWVAQQLAVSRMQSLGVTREIMAGGRRSERAEGGYVF